MLDFNLYERFDYALALEHPNESVAQLVFAFFGNWPVLPASANERR